MHIMSNLTLISVSENMPKIALFTIFFFAIVLGPLPYHVVSQTKKSPIISSHVIQKLKRLLIRNPRVMERILLMISGRILCRS